MAEFERIVITDHDTWLKTRRRFIQASDAAAVLGNSPWVTKTELWDEKKGLKKAKDISDKPYVINGKKMEPYIREQALLDLPYFECDYHEFDILVSKHRPWQGCTLDGELTVIADNPWNLPIGSYGVIECKTGQWKSYKDLGTWSAFPLYYYAQIVHQLAVTGGSFVLTASRVKRDAFKDEDNGIPEIRLFYHLFKREDMLTDIAYVCAEEALFKESLDKDERPKFTI